MILTWFVALLLQASPVTQGLLDIAATQGIKFHDANSGPMFLYNFARGGQRHDSLVLTPGAVFQLDVPRGQGCVSLLASMPFNLGDGAVLKIQVGDEVHEKTLDPAHVRADRTWLPLRFNLPSGPDRIHLRFEVTAGARGDATGDWVGIAPGTDAGCLFSAPRRKSPPR